MTNPTPPGQVPEALDDLYLKLHGLSKRLEGAGRIDEGDAPEAYPTILDAMILVRRLQCEAESSGTDHVQNPAEIEHVAGDVVKDGAEVNTSTQQPAPATQQAGEVEGWLTWFRTPSGGREPNYSHGAKKPTHGAELDAILTKYPVFAAPQHSPTAQQAPAEVRRSDLVPGVMHCAKCKFQLNRVTLCVSDGNAYAGDNKTEPCPNGCGPLWPVTWEQEARNCWKTLEEMHERLQAAQQGATP